MFHYVSSDNVVISESLIAHFESTESPVTISKEGSAITLSVSSSCFSFCTIVGSAGAIYAKLSQVTIKKSHFHQIASNFTGTTVFSELSSTVQHESNSFTKCSSHEHGNIYMKCSQYSLSYCNNTYNKINHITFCYIVTATSGNVFYNQVSKNEGSAGVEFQNQASSCNMYDMIFVDNKVPQIPTGYGVVRQFQTGSIAITNAYFFGNSIYIISLHCTREDTSECGSLTATKIYSDTRLVYNVNVAEWNDFDVQPVFQWGERLECPNKASCNNKNALIGWTFVLNLL